MKTTIVDTFEPLTLIGGAPCPPDDLKLALALAPICVAADGGADTALQYDVDLAAVIGDMDSITDAARAQIVAERVHVIAEQDSTDFDKALRHIRAPVIVAIGFLGGQVDHELAALNTLAKRSAQRIVLLGAVDIVFLCPPRLRLPTPAGTRVSLFPMRRVCGQSRGLHWPIDGITFEPGARAGTSNIATGPIELRTDAPGMLCILPRAFIQPVVSALRELPDHAQWPARAI